MVWDLRTESPDGVPRGRGPLVPPGHYAVELVASFGSVKTSVDVVLDPRLELEAGELEDRYTFLKRVNALRSRIERTVARTASLGEDVDALRDRLAELAESAADLTKPLDGDEEPGSRDPGLSVLATRLFSELDGDDVRQGTLYGPTPVQQGRLARLASSAEEAIARFEAFLESSLPPINETLGETRLELLVN